jgi:hypothetical protein
MANIRDLLATFKEGVFAATVEAYQPSALLYRQYFPLEFSLTRETKILTLDTGAKVMGDFMALDSAIGIKGRETPGTLTVQIPKVGWADRMDESDIDLYHQLMAAAQYNGNTAATVSQMERQVIDLIYKQGTEAVDGIHSRLEWGAKSIASGGEYKLTLANNAQGVKTKGTISAGVPGANFKNASVSWATGATAKPLEDMAGIQKTAKGTGFRINYQFMSQAEFDNLCATTEIREFCASVLLLALDKVGTLNPTLTDINNALRNKGLPQIIVWDSDTRAEDKFGARAIVDGWKEGSVLFSETPILGSTRYTTSVDARVSAKNTVVAQNDFITVKRWGTENPPRVDTIATAYATPVLTAVNKKFILDSTPA